MTPSTIKDHITCIQTVRRALIALGHACIPHTSWQCFVISTPTRIQLTQDMTVAGLRCDTFYIRHIDAEYSIVQDSLIDVHRLDARKTKKHGN
jgi:hypothetical protein